MDAIELLKQDHRAVERLFRQFEHATRKDQKKKIATEVVHELSRHAAIEEQLLYPSIRERAKQLEDLTLEALEEHHVTKWLVHEIDNLPVEHERFDAKMAVLKETVLHHVKEEEGELFPKMRRAFKQDELELLGVMLEEAKKLAPTHPHPRLGDEPPGNFVVGTLAALLDRARDLVRGTAGKGMDLVRDTAGKGMELVRRQTARALPRRATRAGTKRVARATAAKTRRTATKRKPGPNKRR